MNGRFVIHTALVINRFDPRYHEAQKFLDNEVLRDSAPYVPFRTGNLMNSGNTGTVIGSGEVVYNAPYAKKVYYGKNMHFNKEKHPQAQAQWFEKAKATKKEAWVKGVRIIITGR